MNNQKLLNITTGLVKKDFDITAAEEFFISEEALEKALSERLLFMIEHELEQLFAILYRLDVSEQKVHAALKMENEIPGAVAVARLIISRQKEKAITRMEYSQEETDFEDDVTAW
jgi:hypothetical protein